MSKQEFKPELSYLIKVKQGVSLYGVKDELVLAANLVASCYDNLGHECWLTSGREGRHKRLSKHYSGRALDFRIRDFTSPEIKMLFDAIKCVLPNDMVVIHEYSPPHFHLQTK